MQTVTFCMCSHRGKVEWKYLTVGSRSLQLSEVKPNHVPRLGDFTPLNSPSTLIRSPLHDLADDGFPPSKLYLMKKPGLPGG